MSSFTGNILLEQLDTTDMCMVKRQFTFYSYKAQVDITIKKGFLTDLASIPAIIKSIVRGSANRYWRAYVVHDALYHIGYDRKLSDIILDEALEVLGMGSYTRGKIYYGLRMFGQPTNDSELIDNAHQTVIIDDIHIIR